LAWIKKGMEVEMLYQGDTDIYLYSNDGNSCKFKRIK